MALLANTPVRVRPHKILGDNVGYDIEDELAE